MSLRGNYTAIMRGCDAFPHSLRNRCDKADLGEVNKFNSGWREWLGSSARYGNVCACNTDKCNSGLIFWF